MENNETQSLGGSALPPSGRNSGFPVDGKKENIKSEPSTSLTLHLNTSESGDFSHDISRMPDSPPKNIGHRRVRSEIVTLLDDITFDSDLGIVGVGFDGPSYSETEEDLFSIPPPENRIPSSGDRSRVKYQHSVSMDALSSAPEETCSINAKKSMSAAKLAELAVADPKRAKRIWANRQSAVRSKERKMRYIAELESQLQTLQTRATALSAQLTLLQRDTHGLIAENNELKLRFQAMEQQVHVQDVLNEALKKEIHHLRVVTGQNLTNGGPPNPMMNFPPSFRPNHQFHPNNQPMNTLLTAQQLHQLQIQSRMQQQHQFQHQQLHQFQQRQHLHQFQHHPSPPQPPAQQLPENSDVKNSSSLST